MKISKLQFLMGAATELAHTVIESGLYTEGTSVYETAKSILEDLESEYFSLKEEAKSHLEHEGIALSSLWSVEDAYAQAINAEAFILEEVTDKQLFDVVESVANYDYYVGCMNEDIRERLVEDGLAVEVEDFMPILVLDPPEGEQNWKHSFKGIFEGFQENGLCLVRDKDGVSYRIPWRSIRGLTN